jgi:hypothetical protein
MRLLQEEPAALEPNRILPSLIWMNRLSFTVETISEEGTKSLWGVHPMLNFVNFGGFCPLNRPANYGRIFKRQGQWTVKAKLPGSGTGLN